MSGQNNHGLSSLLTVLHILLAEVRHCTMSHGYDLGFHRIYPSNIQSSSVVVFCPVIQPVVNVFTLAFYLINIQCFKFVVRFS